MTFLTPCTHKTNIYAHKNDLHNTKMLPFLMIYLGLISVLHYAHQWPRLFEVYGLSPPFSLSHFKGKTLFLSPTLKQTFAIKLTFRWNISQFGNTYEFEVEDNKCFLAKSWPEFRN